MKKKTKNETTLEDVKTEIITGAKISEMIENNLLIEHHTSIMRGYVSRKIKFENLIAEKYIGHFGYGYILKTARFDSTQYCNVTYYTFIGGNE